MPEVKIDNISFPVSREMSEEEKIIIGQKLSEATIQYNNLETEKKDKMADYNAMLKEIKDSINQYAKTIESNIAFFMMCFMCLSAVFVGIKRTRSSFIWTLIIV